MKHRFAPRSCSSSLTRGMVVSSLALATGACALQSTGLGGSSSKGDGTSSTGSPGTSAPLPDAGGSRAVADASPPAPPPDASDPSDAAALDAAPAPVECDKDNDGAKALSSACGGTDCCDTDARVHPGQVAFFETEGACGGFDYDCDGAEKPEFVTGMCKAGLFSCDGDGFAEPTACGDQADYLTCAFAGIACTGKRAARTQACH